MTIPTDIANLGLWFKADTQVYKDNGVTLAADGDTVQLWKDQSGNGKDASQSTAGSRPTLKTNILNGLPVVRYSAHFFNISRGAAKTYTAFFVFRRNDTSANSSLICDTVSGGNHEIYAHRNSDGTKKRGIWDSTNAWQEAFPTSLTQFDILTFRRDDSAKTIDFWVGTHLTTTGTMGSGAPATGSAMWMGQGTSGGEQFSGDVAEVIYYDAKLSDANVAAIQAYLQGRYNIQPVLNLWLKSDTQVYKDAGSTLAGNGDTVQQWNDQSGSGFNMSQATSGNRPTLATNQVNGYPAVQFRASSSQWMQNLNDLIGIRFTVLYVLKRIDNGATQGLLARGTSASQTNAGCGPQLSSSSNKVWASSDSVNNRISANVLPDGGWEVGAIISDMTNADTPFYLGIALDLDAAGGANQQAASTKTALGQRWNGASGTNFLNADVAELKLYDGRMEDVDVLAQLAALAGKYNLHQPVRVFGTVIG